MTAITARDVVGLAFMDTMEPMKPTESRLILFLAVHSIIVVH